MPFIPYSTYFPSITSLYSYVKVQKRNRQDENFCQSYGSSYKAPLSP